MPKATFLLRRFGLSSILGFCRGKKGKGMWEAAKSKTQLEERNRELQLRCVRKGGKSLRSLVCCLLSCPGLPPSPRSSRKTRVS